jgi:hypothetical protein
MQRVVIYLKRRTDLLQPVFFDWWLGQHKALAEQLPGLRQYTISLAADAQEGPFDGMAELMRFTESLAQEWAPLRRTGQRRGPGLLPRHCRGGRACPLASRYANASSNIFASWRSAVSKPSVNQL